MWELPVSASSETFGAAGKAFQSISRTLSESLLSIILSKGKTLTIVAIAAVVLAILGLLLKVLAKALPVILIVIVVIGILDVLRNKLH